MKKLILCMTAFAVLPVGTLFAQGLAGNWQGLMLVSEKPGDTLRVVFKISTTVSGSLKGDMYSIDQGGYALAQDVTLQGSAVKIPSRPSAPHNRATSSLQRVREFYREISPKSKSARSRKRSTPPPKHRSPRLKVYFRRQPVENKLSVDFLARNSP